MLGDGSWQGVHALGSEDALVSVWQRVVMLVGRDSLSDFEGVVIAIFVFHRRRKLDCLLPPQ